MKAYLEIASNTLFQIFSRAATAIVALVVTRLITSSLGLEGFGHYQIVLSFVTLFWILTDFGLNAVVVREMAAQEEKIQNLFSSLLTLRTGLSLVLILTSLSLLIVLPYATSVKVGILVASLTILAQAVMGSCHSIFQVKLHYDRQFWANLIGSLILLSLMFLVTQEKLGVVALSSAFTIGYLTMSITSVGFVTHWVKFSFSWNKALLKRLFITTLPFGTALLFSLATFKIDAILLSILPLRNLKNTDAVGIYNLGYKVFELALVVPVFFMNVMYPILVKHFEKSKQLFLKTTTRSFLLLLGGGVSAAGVTYLFAPLIIKFLAHGEEFSPSITTLRVLILSAPIFYLSALFMWLLLIFKKQSALILVYATAFIFNLVTNLIFIPRYTFYAAAVITGVTEVLILIMLVSLSFFYYHKIQPSPQNSSISTRSNNGRFLKA